MAETTDLRWPQEAHPWPDQAQAYRLRAYERAQAIFENADWRENGVMQAAEILGGMIDVQAGEESVGSKPFVEALRDANLIPIIESPSNDPAALANNLIFGALVGEAAGVLLVRNTNRRVWSVIEKLVFNLDGVLQSLGAALKSA